jgi:proteasome lid subunit RPN8/RPN11
MNIHHATNTSADRFFKLDIEQNEFPYIKGDFDKVNSHLIAEHLRVDDNQADDFCLVAPNDPTVLLTLVIHSLLEVLEHDISQVGVHGLKDLREGQSVGLIQDRVMQPATFVRFEQMNNRQYYVVETDNLKTPMTIKIPEGREWRIQPYSDAGADTQKRKGTVYGKQLEKILDLPAGGLKAFQKSKILVVPDDKRYFIEQIRNTKVGGDLLESVFPVAEYHTATDWRYIGHFGANNLQQQPSLGIVANADIAIDIALADDSVCLIIIGSAKKLKRNYGSIERLNYDETPRKLIALVSPTDEEEIQNLSSLGIPSWVWKRSDFVETSVTNDSADNDNPYAPHYSILEKLSGSSTEFVEVSLPEEIEKQIDEIYRGLYSLGRNANPLPESGLLVRWGLSLINSILQIPSTLTAYDDFIKTNYGEEKTLDYKIGLYKQKVQSSYGLLIPSVHVQDTEVLLTKLDAVFHFFEENSPKEEALRALISDNREQAVFAATSNCAAFLGKTLGSQIHVSTAERIDSIIKDKGIITGWSNKKNTARAFLAPINHLTWLLYKKEATNVQNIYRTHPSAPDTLSDNELRIKLGYTKPVVEAPLIQQNEDDAQELIGIEELLTSFTEKFGTPDKQTHLVTDENQEEGDKVDAYKVSLSDDSYVYVDKEYKLDRINRAANKLERCKISSLHEGDELVFAETDRSMFEELLAVLQESEEYKALYQQASIWRTALMDYMEQTNTSETELVALFKLVQCPRELQTIRTWLRGQVIGPTGDNYAAIFAIEKITKDPRLIGKTDEVIHACRALHALHVQTGYLLVRTIVNSTVPKDENVNAETSERLEKYSARARLRTVTEVSDYTIPMDVRHIAKLETDEI